MVLHAASGCLHWGLLHTSCAAVTAVLQGVGCLLHRWNAVALHHYSCAAPSASLEMCSAALVVCLVCCTCASAAAHVTLPATACRSPTRKLCSGLQATKWWLADSGSALGPLPFRSHL